MKYWEFLIQKEGERTWKPLKSSKVELTEGQYRMVVRSNRANTKVDIDISYQTDEVPPKIMGQKRSRRTNQDGLMVLFPYTYLKSGNWQLKCQGDLNTDLWGEKWEYSLNLQVLPSSSPLNQEETQPEELTPDFSSSAPDVLSTERLPANRPQITLLISLEQETYIAGKGQSLTIAGQIDILDLRELSGSTDHKVNLRNIGLGELEICLRDPENAKVLDTVRVPIREQVAPARFACPISLPVDCPTRLILGEVVFTDSNSLEQASQPFTIAANLDELLGSIKSDVREEDLLYHTREALNHKELNLNFLNIISKPQTPPSIQFQPSFNPAIPPILDPPLPPKPKTKSPPVVPKSNQKSPQLPRLINVQHRSLFAWSESSSSTTAKTPSVNEPAPIDLPKSVIFPPEPENLPVDEMRELELVNHDDLQTQIEEAISQENHALELSDLYNPATEHEQESPIEEAFESLHLQDRFLSRLNSLASDEELSVWLQTHFSAAEIPMELDQETEVEQIWKKPPQPVINSEEQEVVIDDELVIFPNKPKVVKPEIKAIKSESIPTPILEVPEGELIAGKAIAIKVKLPEPLPNPTCVKLWLQDCQSRSLLTEPRWLMDFTTTGRGQMVAQEMIIIPYGTIEVQFEAIAIEITTQSESYKVTVRRKIGPPAPPTLPLV